MLLTALAVLALIVGVLLMLLGLVGVFYSASSPTGGLGQAFLFVLIGLVIGVLALQGLGVI